MGDESLDAVQDVAIALAHGRGSGTAGVASGIGLRQAEATHHLAGRQEWHEAPPLLFGTKAHDGGSAERGVRRYREPVRRVHLRELLDHDHEADGVEPRAAQLLRPRHTEQPELAHLLDVLPGELPFRVPLCRRRRDLVARELADHRARGEMLLGEIECVVHRKSLGGFGSVFGAQDSEEALAVSFELGWSYPTYPRESRHRSRTTNGHFGERAIRKHDVCGYLLLLRNRPAKRAQAVEQHAVRGIDDDVIRYRRFCALWF